MEAASGIQRVAVIGAGTIGASWAALFVHFGLRVSVWDPAPNNEPFVRGFVERARQTLDQLGGAAGEGALQFYRDPAEAVASAQFVQESAIERLNEKRALFAVLDGAVPPNVVIASSTSGLVMTEMARGLRTASRFVIGHPFNPPHLIPLVEVVGGEQTAPATVESAMAFYRRVGKHPIRLAKEMPGHLANRLQAALWREAVYAVAEGVASVADIDAAIAYGPGIRWAMMGPHLTYALAGGEGGMAHFMEHLGPANEVWWRSLGEPTLTPALQRAIIDGVAEEAGGRSIPELAAKRDAMLVALLQTLNGRRPAE